MCRNDELRQKVNDLLTGGASYALILRTLEQDNAKLDKRERVTIDSIRQHTKRHFPVQNVAKATYRRILEQRAQETASTSSTAWPPRSPRMAFYETVIVKGYETLVDSDTEVDVHTGMIAAGRLEALIESRASGTSIADMLVQMDRIITRDPLHGARGAVAGDPAQRSMDPSRSMHRRMSWKTVSTRRTSTTVRGGRRGLLDSMPTASLSTSRDDYRLLRRDPFPNRRSGRCTGCHRVGSPTTRKGPTRTTYPRAR